MSTTTATTLSGSLRGTAARESGLAGLARRHPLVAYFILGYLFTWPLIVPIVISQRGVGWVDLPETLLGVLFILSTFTGPLPAAFVMTALTDGKSGVRTLLRRVVQWRVGIGWYLLVIIGYPAVLLLGLSLGLGTAPLIALLNNPSLLVSVYLPGIAFGLVFPAIGEEPGWRGFALPRLQRQYGPVLGSLILGVLHALWHTPAYFVRGAISDNGFEAGVFLGNSLAIVCITFIWTWLFNSASGIVLFAMLLHSTSNASSQMLNQLSNADPGVWDRLFAVLLALLVIAATRGRLAYRNVLPVSAQSERRPA